MDKATKPQILTELLSVYKLKQTAAGSFLKLVCHGYLTWGGGVGRGRDSEREREGGMGWGAGRLLLVGCITRINTPATC